MRFQIPCFRLVNIRLVAIFTLELLLTSCGGGNWTPTNAASTSPPLIQAIILGFHSGGIPANQPTAMVGVNDASTGAPITNATVTVNGVTLVYNAALGHEEYEGVVSINPGVRVTLVVQTGGKTYTSTATQITTYPVISTPVSGAAFLSGDANVFAWSSGAPLTSAATYSLIIADANDPVGVSPDISVYPTGVTSTSRIGITPGNKVVILGLSNMTTIANADPNSYMDVGGYSYVPVTVYPVAAPTNVQLSLGDAQATLAWGAVANASSYNLYWSTTAANANKAAGTKITGVTTPFVHTGLTNGATYYYSVTAVGNQGEGPESAVISVTPSALISPSADAGITQATISWPALTGITSYNIYWSTTAANATKLAGGKITNATNSYLHTALTNGTPYYYTVVPVYPAGEGAESPVVKAIPGTTIMGGAVQGFPLSLTNTISNMGGVTLFSRGVATDGSNLYFADYNAIKKVVIASGAVSTLAGSSGVCGSVDGVGAAASFCSPTGITIDGANLYVADSANCTIRKIVIQTGSVSTFAGTSGVNCWANSINSATLFSTPYGITTDGVNLYVADQTGNNIRKVDIATATVTTLATGGFNGPTGITTDGVNLYVADNQSNAIKQIVIGTGAITVVAGSNNVGSFGLMDGFSAGALFTNPQGITTDGVNLYVADTGNDAIRKIVISTGEVSTLAGANAGVAMPQGIVTDGVSLFFTEGFNGNVKKMQ